MSPSSPTPPVKRKQQVPQLDEPPGGLGEAGEDRRRTILQLDGDVSGCSDAALQPSLPLPSSLPLPNNLATVKNQCWFYNSNKFFNYDYKMPGLFVEVNM
jgi:hypothetical protein